MRQIYGYNNMKKVVGIQSTSNAVYYHNRYYRRQQEQEYRREQRRREKERERLRKPQGNGNARTYKSDDVNVIYYKEYCKTRNTRVYNQLNSNVKTDVIKYENKYPKYVTQNSGNVNRMLEAYSNQPAKNKKVIIDFETRDTRKPDNKNKKTDKKILGKKAEKKAVMSKKDEVKAFKQSMKPQGKTELDKAVIEFEKALESRKKYEDELRRKNGYKVIKGGRER